jgi:hypothetical protein
VGKRVRLLIAPGLIAASLAAVIVTGMHSRGTLSPPPSRAKATNPYIDTRTGCEHLTYGCTGQKRAYAGTGRVVFTEFVPRAQAGG